MPDKLATPIIYFTEIKTNAMFFLVNCLFYLFSFVFGHTACGILGFWMQPAGMQPAGMQPAASAIVAWCLNHWTAREVH